MSRVLSGSPVLRHQVFVLDDGSPVVQWAENHVQEIYSGRVRTFDYGQYGHPVTDHELSHLKSLGLVEHYTRQYVWVFALPEQSLFMGLRTIDGAFKRARTYYLNTTLSETALNDVVAALEANDGGAAFTAGVHEGIVAVLGAQSIAYDTLQAAEAGQRALTALSPTFENTVVAFIEVPLEQHIADEATQLDLNALIASQSASAVTEGKQAVVVCSDDLECVQVEQALRGLKLDVQAANSGAQALRLLEDCAESAHIPDVLVMNLRLDDMHGWELVCRIREIQSLSTLPVIALAADVAFDEPALALTVGGLHSLLALPLNAALLRQSVYETLRLKESTKKY
jgi:CheY-like chemotaxis protein